jgi:hypothetical protein
MLLRVLLKNLASLEYHQISVDWKTRKIKTNTYINRSVALRTLLRTAVFIKSGSDSLWVGSMRGWVRE